MSGAQTFLNQTESYFWRFSSSGTMEFFPINATFELKRGSSASEDAVLRLYESNASGQIISTLGTATLSAASATGQFATYSFQLTSTPVTLPAYFNLELTSAAGTTSNVTWFIKDPKTGTFKFSDGSGGEVSTVGYLGYGEGDGTAGSSSDSFFSADEGGSGDPVAVPEPSSLALVATAGTYYLYRRRRQIVNGPHAS